MIIRITNGRATGGFTLVEIIIVAALISLFSGLAMFGVQQMLKNSKLKAVIGETRQVGSALTFAHQDIGFYPAIGFLSYNKDFISNNYGWGLIDSMGLTITGLRVQHTYDKWSGPYFAASPTRNQLSYKFRGVVTMLLTNGYNIDWPADQWGNPYVLYLFKYIPATASWEFVQTSGEEPNFWAAVVSYGPDGVPGSPAGGDTVDSLLSTRLFEQPDPRVGKFNALLPEQYNNARRERYSFKQINPNDARIGIVDAGSDDLIYNID
jgi:prepilin-type N-terminal cleavage/methylation domain-containing protein